MTADITVYCKESATAMILVQLRNSLSNQGNRRIFGTTVLQVLYAGEDKTSVHDKYNAFSQELSTLQLILGKSNLLFSNKTHPIKKKVVGMLQLFEDGYCIS